MRQGEMLTYLHGDHLGSASLATDAAGAQLSTQRYLPYGGTRDGAMPTDRQFTGQRHETSLGFYDYNARQYDPALGRFLQADSLVPQPGNPQSLNRYAYTLNNPLRYTDPSGHMTDEEIAQVLGFGSVDELYASELWQLWNSRGLGDSYWIALLKAIQSGDRLYATERLGHLRFQNLDGKMRIIDQDDNIYESLWAWQGAGIYTIDRPGLSDRDNDKLSDQIFSKCFASTWGFGGWQPAYSYHISSDGIGIDYLYTREIQRFPLPNATGLFDTLSRGKYNWGPMADFVVDGVLIFVAEPLSTNIGIGKLIVDVGLTAHKSITDPVYHYRVVRFP